MVRGCGLVTPSLGRVSVSSMYPLTKPACPAAWHIPLAVESRADVEVVREQGLSLAGAKELTVWARIKEELLLKDFAV